MKIEKIINNNLIRTTNKQGQRVILMGCGIGFQKKPGCEVDEDKIEQIYVEKDSEGRLEQVLKSIPVECIQTANEVISYARSALGKRLNDTIYLTLTDHIAAAVRRTHEGILIKNALLWEIRRFYNHEFLVAKEALRIIERRLSVSFPEDEAGFLALHFVNATMESADVGTTAEMTKVIQHILSLVKYYFKFEPDEYSLHYERFLVHTKFFVYRLFQDTQLYGENPIFLDGILCQYQKEYACAEKIAAFLDKEYHKTVTRDELCYMTVHLHRITTENL